MYGFAPPLFHKYPFPPPPLDQFLNEGLNREVHLVCALFRVMWYCKQVLGLQHG